MTDLAEQAKQTFLSLTNFARRSQEEVKLHQLDEYEKRTKFWVPAMMNLQKWKKNVSMSDELFAQLLGRLFALKDMNQAVDSLTGIWNRRAIVEFGESLISHTQRTNEPLTFAVLDIDHFKQFNDTYKHIVGDEVLQMYVKRIQPHIRTQDKFGRYGGEEFLLVLPNTSQVQAQTLLERIKEDIAENLKGSITRTKIEEPITTSIGFCEYVPGDDFKSLFNKADAALYVAKGEWNLSHDSIGGRNRIMGWQKEFPIQKPT